MSHPIWYDDTGRAETRRAFLKAVKDHLGFDASHLTFQYSLWNLSTWREDEMSEIIDKPQNTLKVLDKLWGELATTDRNTTIEPFETRIKLGIPESKPIEYNLLIPNIITTSGLVEMAKRGTDEHSTGTGCTHGAVGTGSTAEALADVALETEKARKAFSTDGVSQVSGTTERYGMPFTAADVTAGSIITEAALLTKVSGGECVSRVTAAGVTVNTGRIMTMQTDITHANGTQI